MPHLVLIVEDETILGDSVSTYLERHGYATAVARSGEEGVRFAEESSPDVAIVDIRLPGIDGLEVLRRVREVSPSTELVMMTAHASVATAVEAMKHGAFDYLTKPVDLEELRVVVDKVVAHLRMRRELSYLKGRVEGAGQLSEIVGECPPIQVLREQIQRIAALDSPGDGGAPTVLILGETGAGKELVARAIHYQSPRSSGPFVEVNCAAIPATLLEAEVFGYEKGAYTDARSAKPGLFEAADGGTLFLDEIGHLELALQGKLLKALEEKAIRRVGGLRAKTVNVRIITATNRDLEAAVAAREFRADLYYRIKVLTIPVPPLRDRGSDITLLARHFLERFTRQYGLPAKELTPAVEACLLRYSWPGNVRELAHAIERGVLLHPGSALTPEDLAIAGDKPESSVVVKAGGGIRVDFSAGGIALDDVERQLIVEALEAVGWNRTRAARLLRVSTDTLRYRMEKYQVHPPKRATARSAEPAAPPRGGEGKRSA